MTVRPPPRTRASYTSTAAAAAAQSAGAKRSEAQRRATRPPLRAAVGTARTRVGVAEVGQALGDASRALAQHDRRRVRCAVAWVAGGGEALVAFDQAGRLMREPDGIERRALRRVREERVARLVSSATMVSAMVSRATARLAIAREVRAARLRTLQIHVCCACNSLLVATQGCARRPHRLTLTP